MNKNLNEAQENMRSVIQRIATGPELSKNISRDEAKDQCRIFLMERLILFNLQYF